mgnify:CR=1 FL=1
MFTVSNECFTQKPNCDEIRKISYVRRDLNLDEVVDCIKGGYVMSANFCDDYSTTITQRDRRYDNFVSTTMIMYDLDDDIDCSLDELVCSLIYKPSVSYTTYSHQTNNKGNRYRLLYLFEKPIQSIEVYKSIYNEIKSSFNFSIDDNCGVNPTQAVFGSHSGCEVVVTDSSYSIDDFQLTTANGHSNSICKEKRNNIEIESLFQNQEYKYDFYHLSYQELIDIYKDIYPFFEHTPLPPTRDDCPYILLPEDYIHIKRYWLCQRVKDEYGDERWKYAKIRKIKDGEHRRKKLFLNGILRRKMIPNIVFEHLLHCLIFELWHYYENGGSNCKNIITKHELAIIAADVMRANVDNYTFEKKDRRQFIVNDAYCQKYNVSRKEARNLAKKLITYERIGMMYNATLTDKQNIMLFQQHGLNISLKTLQRFRKDMGLNKYNKDKQEES